MSLPYFPMYPTDFEADTSHLTLEEDGAYNRLLRLMWMTPGCSLPDDNAWITRRLRVDSATFERVVAPLILEFFERQKGRVFSVRLLKEFCKAEKTSSLRANAGKKGGRKQAVENKTKDAKAGLSGEQGGLPYARGLPEPEPYREKTEDKSSAKKPPSKRTQIAPDWSPSQANLDYARSKKMNDREIENAAEQFRNYHLAKGTVFSSWDAGWRTWVVRNREYGGGVAGAANTGTGQRIVSLASIAARNRDQGFG